VTSRKASESSVSPGEEKIVQASQRCSAVYRRPPRITVVAAEPVSLSIRGTRMA
jgi:hypothetical protein